MNIRPLAGALLLALAAPAQANIDIQFDYSLDDNNFFGVASRKTVLESAASVFESRFADSLSAITSGGANSFDPKYFDPANPSGALLINDSDSFAADVIRVYAGGFNFSGGTLGTGGPGGFNCSGSGSYCPTTVERGQGDVSGTDATDVAPWGGSISFDTDANWHFGTSTNGLDSNEFDFYSVALHELGHLLGFAGSASFTNHIVGSNFVGTAVGNVALNGDKDHWANGTQSLVNGVAQEAAMTARITSGTRKYFTDLDFAAMQDIGWQVTAVPEADTWAMLLAGLGLVGFATRRRMA